MITALGFDPGLRATGYSIIQGDRYGCRVVALGDLRSSSQTDFIARLQEIYEKVEAVLREVEPDVIVLEDVFAHALFPRTALYLAHLRGVICLAGIQAGVPVETMAPAEVKRALTGSGRASKPQVQRMVRVLTGLAAPPRTHAADAAALALTALSRRGVRLQALPLLEAPA